MIQLAATYIRDYMHPDPYIFPSGPQDVQTRLLPLVFFLICIVIIITQHYTSSSICTNISCCTPSTRQDHHYLLPSGTQPLKKARGQNGDADGVVPLKLSLIKGTRNAKFYSQPKFLNGPSSKPLVGTVDQIDWNLSQSADISSLVGV